MLKNDTMLWRLFQTMERIDLQSNYVINGLKRNLKGE